MESETQGPEVAAPFEKQPADLGGCGKPAVVGCLAILLLLAVGLVLLMTKATSMLDWALLQYQNTVVSNISDEVSAEEKARLVSAFEAARTAVREKQVDPTALRRLQRFMSSPPPSGQSISADTVRDLTEVLESLAGGRTPAEPSTTDPVVTPIASTATPHHVFV